jgi:peptidoglycan/LPS O-acetylase OafA/YrhL
MAAIIDTPTDNAAGTPDQGATTSTAKTSNRYHTIDALRGLAALSVALFHLYGSSMEGLRHMIPEWISAVFDRGFVGVAGFFVISGFVIAASVGEARVDGRYIGKFALKRSVRLDPPYWLSMALDLTLLALTIKFFHSTVDWPSTAKILSHFIYAQDLMSYGSIADIYWTLCLEVQFYIFYVLVLAILMRSNQGRLFTENKHFTPIACFLLFGAGIYSLLIRCGAMYNPIPGLFLSHWCWYFLGVLSYWCAVKKRLHPGYFWGFVLLLALSISYGLLDGRRQISEATAGLTAIFIYWVTIKGKHSTYLNWRPLTLLGTVSYSLYLFHAIIGERVVELLREELLPRSIFGYVSTPLEGAMVMTLAFAVVFFVCHLVFIFVEKPSMAISKRIKPAQKGKLLADA